MKSKKRHLALLGPRKIGKSTLAKKIAAELKWPLFNTDELVLKKTNSKDIAELIEKKGWSFFRDCEYETLKEIIKENKSINTVIDCGGGILVEIMPSDREVNIDKKVNIAITKILPEVFSEKKSRLLKKYALNVFLKRDINALDFSEDSSRPPLSLDYRKLLERRYLWYKKQADEEIDLDSKKISEVAQELTRLAGNLYTRK